MSTSRFPNSPFTRSPLIYGGGIKKVLGAGATPTLSFRNSYTGTTDQTTFTFLNCDLGAAAANRSIIVSAAWRASVTRTFVSATINGVSAALVLEQGNSGSSSAIISAAVPTGATGTIAITLNLDGLRMGIGVYAAYALNSLTATDTAASTSGTPTLSVDTLDDGIVIATIGSTSPSPVWTGVSQDFLNSNIESSFGQGGASASGAVAATPHTV